MTKSERKIIERLRRHALITKSTLQTRRQYHIAAIYKKGIPLSLACNQRKTHPKVKENYPFDGMGIHAELAAILGARGLGADYSDCSIYVIRLDNNNQLAHSAPCPHCAKLIKQLNFKKVIHS